MEHAANEYVVNLTAVNGKYVTALCGGDNIGDVQANRDAAGEWETFYIAPLDNGNVSIRSSHGRYLSAEMGGGAAVHANRTALGPWETFQLQGSLTEGSPIGFKASDNAHFLTARIDQNPVVIAATAPNFQPWENFTVHVISSPVPPPSAHVDPKIYSVAQLRDFQGDLMLWVPAVKPNFVGNEDPVTHIRRIGDNGGVARGIEAGWVWTLTVDRFPKEQRELIYQAARDAGYTHFAFQVSGCHADSGYHGLYPVTDCSNYDQKVNTILQEIWDHKLIPICSGVSPTDPVTPGLDKSLCRVVMNDWDNSDEADCHIKVLNDTFPDAQIMYELPAGVTKPKPDACSPVPFPATGGEWIRRAQQKYPNFFGVGYEINQPDGLDANVNYLNQLNPFWRDLQQIQFETDTYWKFWDNLDVNAEKNYNDALHARAPQLRGFMSGGTTHPQIPNTPPPNSGPPKALDLHQAQIFDNPGNLADWPETTQITKLEIRPTGVHVEFSKQDGPGRWPDVIPPGWDGALQYTMGLAERINGQWYASAAIQLWHGLNESGGNIGEEGQIPNNWYYDNRWGPMRGYQPAVGEEIGIFVVAGNLRGVTDGSQSPVKERSNVIIIPRPTAAGASYVFQY